MHWFSLPSSSLLLSITLCVKSVQSCCYLCVLLATAVFRLLWSPYYKEGRYGGHHHTNTSLQLCILSWGVYHLQQDHCSMSNSEGAHICHNSTFWDFCSAWASLPAQLKSWPKAEPLYSLCYPPTHHKLFERFQAFPRHISGMNQAHLRNISSISQIFIRQIQGTTLSQFRHISGIFQAYLMNVLGTTQLSVTFIY